MKTLIRLIILVAALAAGWLIREQLNENSHFRGDKLQWVKLADEPPPPPPPPKVEQPPEPEALREMPEEQLQDVIEEPQEEQAATDESLGVDEEGRAGSDSFGLRAKKGGRDLLRPDQDSGAAHRGLSYLTYGGKVTSELQRFLHADQELRKKSFTMVIQLWINPTGKVERCGIEKSSGDPETDERLIQLVSAFSGRLATPPAGMPQPIKLRIRTDSASGHS